MARARKAVERGFGLQVSKHLSPSPTQPAANPAVPMVQFELFTDLPVMLAPSRQEARS